MVMLSAYDFSIDRVQGLDSIDKIWPYATEDATEWETPMMLHDYPELVDVTLTPEKIVLPIKNIPL